jgi:hypothetical protein
VNTVWFMKGGATGGEEEEEGEEATTSTDARASKSCKHLVARLAWAPATHKGLGLGMVKAWSRLGGHTWEGKEEEEASLMGEKEGLMK